MGTPYCTAYTYCAHVIEKKGFGPGSRDQLLARYGHPYSSVLLALVDVLLGPLGRLDAR